MTLALTLGVYVWFAIAGWCAKSCSTREHLLAGRGAWFSVSAIGMVFLCCPTEAPFFLFWSSAAMAFSLAALRLREARRLYVVGLAATFGFVWGWFGRFCDSDDVLAAIWICIAIGAELARWMQLRRQLAVRTTLLWCSYIATFAVLLPRAVSGYGHTLANWPAGAAVCLIFAVFLGGSATWAFASADGTPEPLDPPQRWVTMGIYRHLNHPMQLAQIATVWASAFWHTTTTTLLYALGFSLLLMGPFRWLEEYQTRHRLGPRPRALQHNEFKRSSRQQPARAAAHATSPSSQNTV